MTRAFVWENPREIDNSITVAPDDDGSLSVSVEEEKAVDSYNSTFNCCVVLPKAQALKLLAALTEWYSQGVADK